MRRDVAAFEHRLAASLRAGIPLPQALAIASDGLGAPLKEAVAGAERRVRAGSALAAALGAERGLLRDVELAVLRVGEETGLLPENLDRLAAWNEREAADVRKLALGLLYPAILLVLAFLLPPLPRWVTGSFGAYALAVAGTAGPFVLVLAAGVGTALLLRRRAPEAWARLLGAVPFLGRNLKKLAIARFGESLAMLYASGVALPRALGLAARAFGDPALERRARRIPQVVEKGGSLADAFAAAGIFPASLVGAVAVGERTGELDRALEAFARLSREEADAGIRVLLILLPIAVYLLVALYVGIVVVSAFSAYFRTLGQF